MRYLVLCTMLTVTVLSTTDADARHRRRWRYQNNCCPQVATYGTYGSAWDTSGSATMTAEPIQGVCGPYQQPATYNAGYPPTSEQPAPETAAPPPPQEAPAPTNGNQIQPPPAPGPSEPAPEAAPGTEATSLEAAPEPAESTDQ